MRTTLPAWENAASGLRLSLRSRHRRPLQLLALCAVCCEQRGDLGEAVGDVHVVEEMVD